MRTHLSQNAFEAIHFIFSWSKLSTGSAAVNVEKNT